MRYFFIFLAKPLSFAFFRSHVNARTKLGRPGKLEINRTNFENSAIIQEARGGVMFRCNDEEKRESGRGKYAASNQTIVLLTKPTSCAVVPASLHLRPISLHICEHNLDLPFIVIELKKCYKWVVAKKMHINSCKTLSISPFSFKTDTQTKR